LRLRATAGAPSQLPPGSLDAMTALLPKPHNHKTTGPYPSPRGGSRKEVAFNKNKQGSCLASESGLGHWWCGFRRARHVAMPSTAV
jgi:hypothetical protein